MLVSALLSTSHSGCSAISATLECREAERAVAQGVATTPRGIYQLTLAHAYLEKAREEASEAHYGSASALAQAATLATHRAMKSVSGRTSAGHGAKGLGE